jgi:hypothetical protein
MPLPRKKDDGLSGAPVLDLMKCRVRLFDVIEHTEPYTVTKKSTGAEYQLDPQFECTVEVLDDNEDGSANGTKFYEGFRYKLGKDGEWHNNSNSKLGQLTQVVKPGYFDDHSIAPLSADDLEGFEMICRIKPKKNPNTGQITGSTIDWETMRAVPTASVVAAAADEEDEDFGSISF